MLVPPLNGLIYLVWITHWRSCFGKFCHSKEHHSINAYSRREFSRVMPDDGFRNYTSKFFTLDLVIKINPFLNPKAFLIVESNKIVNPIVH